VPVKAIPSVRSSPGAHGQIVTGMARSEPSSGSTPQFSL